MIREALTNDALEQFIGAGGVVVPAKLLAIIGPEFTPLKEIRASDLYRSIPDAVSVLSHWMSRKGLVWAEKGQVRLTELGRSLQKLAQPEAQP